MDGWMDGWVDGWMDRWVDGWMDGWVDGWMDRWVNGWMDRWVDGWVDEWIDQRGYNGFIHPSYTSSETRLHITSSDVQEKGLSWNPFLILGTCQEISRSRGGYQKSGKCRKVESVLLHRRNHYIFKLKTFR